MKILFVDDESDILFLVKRFLGKNGFIVDTETNGQKGLVSALVNKYDVILLDLNLLDYSGIDICKKIRDEGITTPIFFVTGNKEDEKVLGSFKSGCDDYIRKPFNLEELLARIHAVLRRPKDFIENKINLDRFSLDINKKGLYIDDNFVSLTNKEFMIVEFLVRNKNKVSTRYEIFENAWDVNANPFSNIVETFIKKIRKKIRKYTSDEFIHNIKGVGYYIGDGIDNKK